jgi:dTMP kinase
MTMSNDSPLFIAVEGLDGCGKSTLARLLAEALGAEFLRTPLDLDGATRTAMETHCGRSPLARMLLYGATVASAAVAIRDALAAGRSVVVDRYWLSTVVYHRVMGSSCTLDEVAGALPLPDFTIFLRAPLEVRARRVQMRGLATDADRWSLQPEPSARIEAMYREHGRHAIAGRFIELDASEHSAEALTRTAVELVRR